MCDEAYDQTDIAVLCVMLEAYPKPLNGDQITKRIIELGLLDMTEEELEEYHNSLILAKEN